MLKIVLDTNVIISAFFWKGNEYELFKLIEQGKAQLFISQEIIDELEDVLNRPKLQEVIKQSNQTVDEMIKKVISLGKIVETKMLPENIVKSDKKDDKFIECALSAKADVIVSGDNHLLDLKKYENTMILRVKEVFERFF
ncbi:MAG: putative toxin-antitoxin system toxin component, PIN family [Candidatus Woesearchaeota archaeon]